MGECTNWNGEGVLSNVPRSGVCIVEVSSRMLMMTRAAERYLSRVLCAACLMTLVLLAGCAAPGKSAGMSTSEDAAQAFVSGVAEGDAALVSQAMGYDVNSAEVSRWRKEVLGLEAAVGKADPLLDEGDSESPDSVIYFLDAIDSDEQRFSVDDSTLNEVVILVVKDRGWNVVTADPLDPID